MKELTQNQLEDDICRLNLIENYCQQLADDGYGCESLQKLIITKRASSIMKLLKYYLLKDDEIKSIEDKMV